MQKIICIAGPTASGKTGFSIELAKKYNGEIISADSMQIYKGMDIGTAKPTNEEMQGIAHHMISVCDADKEYSVSKYVEEASLIINEVTARGKLPIVCGGTGLYMDNLVRGGSFAPNPSDTEIRQKINEFTQQNGAQALYDILVEKDPESAKKLHVNDVKRVGRALEVLYLTGRSISEHNESTKDAPKRFDALFIGLCYSNREELYERINLRVDMMMKDGLLDEVKGLLKVMDKTSLQAIGYKELVEYLNGEITLEEATELIKQNSRRYAKRQMTWFKRNENVNWLDRSVLSDSEVFEKMCKLTEKFL